MNMQKKANLNCLQVRDFEMSDVRGGDGNGFIIQSFSTKKRRKKCKHCEKKMSRKMLMCENTSLMKEVGSELRKKKYKKRS